MLAYFGGTESFAQLMSKRQRNVFGSESESESESKSDVQAIKRSLKNPRSKKLYVPSHAVEGAGNLTNSENKDDKDASPTLSDYEVDNREVEDYMKFPVEKSMTKPDIHTSLFVTSANSTGLSMMEKMGFKVGDTLGAPKASSTTEGSHLLEPIKPKQRLGRAGIGASSSEPRLVEVTEGDVSRYRESIHNSKLEKKTQILYMKLMKLCLELEGDDISNYRGEDKEKSISDVNPLWRPYVVTVLETERKKNLYNRIIEIDNLEQEKDVTEVPPQEGNSRRQDDAEDGPNSDEGSLPLPERITQLLLHLRRLHNYCFFCGCFFENANDLKENCPGIEEIDHKESL